MSFYYHLYGLNVESDLALPELRSPAGPRNRDSSVHLFLRDALSHWPIDTGVEESTLIFCSAQNGSVNNPNVRIEYFDAARSYRFLYGDGIAFALDHDGKNIWGIWPPQMSLEDLMVYLLGPVFAFALRLRGFTVLHASAALIRGNAVAFVGTGGAGKSTIVGALARGGYPILSDDTAVLGESSEEFCITPTYPHVRLWPGSVSLLFGAKDALPKLVPSSEWNKCFLDLDQHGFRFQTERAPLRCIYLLEPYSLEVQAARVEEIRPVDAFARLAANTCVNYGLTTEMRAREFHALGQLVKRVVTKRLTLGNSLNWIAALGPFLAQDLAPGGSSQPHLESGGQAFA
ncbi:MAG: hypothetical protein ACR2MF_00275 [Chthoniobacterales bacterium]